MASLGARSKTGSVKVHRAEDMAKAFELRTKGLSQRAIAAALDCSVGKVNDLLQAGIKEHPAESVAVLRQVEGDRLDADYMRLERVIDDVSENAKPGSTYAAKAIIDAIAQRTAISEKRSKLYGLQAKQEIDLSGSLALTHDVEDELLDRLARLAAEAATSEDSEESDASGEAGPQT